MEDIAVAVIISTGIYCLTNLGIQVFITVFNANFYLRNQPKEDRITALEKKLKGLGY